ncbi:hypothetical protein ACFYKT_12340 [Cytobacillus sp. FJAT-53684]|uniref:DnaD domain-containing protein n=1 Tax=Cytobacillus mangrovibacter TaxID=3299024 RepID=A0ABW6JYY8_9BACI
MIESGISKSGVTSFRNVRKSGDYTQVENTMINDHSLTLQAKGLLMILLSNSDDWKIHMKNIISRSKNGRDAHYKIINELIEKGYFARLTISNKESRMFEKMEYIFSDIKEDVISTIEQMKKWADEHEKILDIEYGETKKAKNQIVSDMKETNAKPDTDQTDTANPYPLTQETVNPNTALKHLTNQDNKKNNLEKTKNKKTNSKNKNRSNPEEQILSLDIAKPIQIVLRKKMDRLISDGINLNDILLSWETEKNANEGLNQYQYADMLETALTFAKGKIGSRGSVSNFLKTAIHTYKNRPVHHYQEEKKKPFRTEMLPPWFDEDHSYKIQKKTAESSEMIDQKKKKLAETIAQLRESRPIDQETVLSF